MDREGERKNIENRCHNASQMPSPHLAAEFAYNMTTLK